MVSDQSPKFYLERVLSRSTIVIKSVITKFPRKLILRESLVLSDMC